MAHPFYDTITFPFYRGEAQELLRVLNAITDATGVLNAPAAITNMYNRCGPGLPPLTVARFDLMWVEAVQQLTVHGLFKKFCKDLKTNSPGNQNLLNALLAVESAQLAILTRLISSEVVMLDRASLRRQIELIAPEDAAKKVIIVRGETQSGKSYGRHLFELSAKEAGAEPLYLYNGIIPTLNLMLNQLYSAIEPGKIAPEDIDTTDDAWHQKICFELQALASAKKKVIWIAVDDLGERDNAPLLDPKIKDFFDQFANNMMNPPFRRSFRLMLIHYPPNIPTKWKKEIYVVNETKESDIRNIEIEEALKEWRTKTGKLLTDENITAIATEILDTASAVLAPGENTSRLERIHEALKDKFQTL